MPSWNRVIKADRTSSGTNKATIDTDYEYAKEIVTETPAAEPTEMVSVDEKERILQDAEQKRQELLAATEQEIEHIKEEAYQTSYEQGYAEGTDKGYQTGYEEGYREASEKAHAENIEMRKKALEMMNQAHLSIEQYESERKGEFLKLATHMAEKIVNDYIDQKSEGILAIAKPFFYQLDKEEEFVTIAVHPTQREVIEENLTQVKSISPETRFMVLADPNLDEKGMVIESSEAVIDLKIKQQLETMLEEFREMERTVDA